MAAWAAIALALREPEQDALHSRLATYLHPLAGRSLVWHVLSAAATLRPAPASILLVTRDDIDRSVIGELPIRPVAARSGGWWIAARAQLPPQVEHLLLIDAAAPLLATSLSRLVAGPAERVLIGEGGAPLAVWVARSELDARAAAVASHPDPLVSLASGLDSIEATAAEGVLVRDRAQLAHAIRVMRNRNVANLLEAGVTFLLPESVLVDVDVRIGVDTVIYPGVVLEGRTTIGAETVVGPGCRIIDSWIGSGVELKGWNYISGANVRNRAVLEPYVRRGFD